MMKKKYKIIRLCLTYSFFCFSFLVSRRITQTSLFAGALLIVGALSIRLWASGHLTKRTVLATSGPYAFMRNPMYAGNFLLGLGICVILNLPWLVLFYGVFFTYVYSRMIRQEEAYLTRKFEREYRDYVRHVPCAWPRLLPYRQGRSKKFSARLAFVNGEFIRLPGFLAALPFFTIWRT